MFLSPPQPLSQSLCGLIPDPISLDRLNKEIYQPTPSGTQFVLVIQQIQSVRGGAHVDKTWCHSINMLYALFFKTEGGANISHSTQKNSF